MVRAVLRFEIVYGHAREVIAGLEALNGVHRDNDWTEWTAWAPFSGKGNEVIVTCDFPDVATYLAQRDAALANAEWMQAWGRCAQHAAQGSIQSEFLEPVPTLG
jgi:NIPSNAP protein